MEIVVCIKQVLDTYSEILNETSQVDRASYTLINNPNDLNALEAALELKERVGGSVTCISMAPPTITLQIKELLAFGIDRFILLSDSYFAGSDTLATSYILSQAIKKLDYYDLILTGMKSMDGETSQVGPSLATFLNLPYLTNVTHLQIKNASNHQVLEVTKHTESKGYLLEAHLPLLLSVQNRMNEVRIPSILNRMKAANATYEVWNHHDIGVDHHKIGLIGSPTQVLNVYEPEMLLQKQATEVFIYEEDHSCLLKILSKIRTV